jgi:hypothetical protein
LKWGSFRKAERWRGLVVRRPVERWNCIGQKGKRKIGGGKKNREEGEKEKMMKWHLDNYFLSEYQSYCTVRIVSSQETICRQTHCHSQLASRRYVLNC